MTKHFSFAEPRQLPADEVEAAGFSKFNGGNHLCVEIPDGHSTITCRTSEGRLVTFSFVPTKTNVPGCVDVHVENSGKTVMNGSTPRPVQKVICFGPGYDSFRSEYTDAKPTTLMTVILRPYVEGEQD